MGKINVCAYARVSTDSRDQENSFENQKSYFQREISKNTNYYLTEVYKDRGLTATTTARRKDFLRMIHDAGIDVDMYAYTHQNREKHEQVFLLSDREPLFKKIFVKNTSRFARNIDVIDLLRKLRQKGVYVEFLDINKTTENEADFVFIEMLLVFDENDSRDKSRKVKFGQLEGMKRGVIHTNGRLYGYNLIDKYNLEIVPEEAEIIKFIFENYADGDGVRVIINKLKEKGYKTRQGKDFVKSTVLNILKNPKYKGDNVRNRYTTGTIFVDKTITSQVRPEEDWIIHENMIPAIVSDELFQKCEDVRLSRNEDNRGVYRGRTKYVGVLKCGQCGANYIRNSDRGRYFYNCSTKKREGVNVCNNINISEKEIDESIHELCNGGLYADLIDDRGFYIWQLGEIAKKIHSEMEKGIDKDKQQELRNQLEEVKIQKNRLADLYLSGRVDINYFDNKTKDLDREIKKLDVTLKYMYNDKDTFISELKEIERIINQLQNLDIKEKYTEDEMLQQIESISIQRNPEEEKGLILSFSYKMLLEMNTLIEKYL